ncbi:MAG: transposase [Verrucomicrobia bacterium]|nr:transposase [Verrucomicrobiota bacterium]
MWADGVHVKAGLEKGKAALLVAITGCADGRKRLVALVAGPCELEATWSAVLRDLKRRALRCPKLVESDGHLGIWAGLRNVYPDASERGPPVRCAAGTIGSSTCSTRCQAVPGPGEAAAQADPYADSEREALRLCEHFQASCHTHELDDAAALLERDWDRMVTFCRFRREHCTHLRTTNVVESPFGALRLCTPPGGAKRFKNVENAAAVIFKMLQEAETEF